MSCFMTMQRVTNADGRVPDLLPPSDVVEPGSYRITFDTGRYAAACKAQHPAVYPDRPFYPAAPICFDIAPNQVTQGVGWSV